MHYWLFSKLLRITNSQWNIWAKCNKCNYVICLSNVCSVRIPTNNVLQSVSYKYSTCINILPLDSCTFDSMQTLIFYIRIYGIHKFMSYKYIWKMFHTRNVPPFIFNSLMPYWKRILRDTYFEFSLLLDIENIF